MPAEYKTCRWHFANQVPLIATVAAWEKLNGQPFVFNGFGWDFGGFVRSWEDGRIEKLLPGVRLAADCELPYPERMVGDVSIRSDDPEIGKLKCTVDVLDFQ
jgi:hypothetical protein